MDGRGGGGIYLICIERDTFLTYPTFYPSDRFYKAGNKTNRVKGGFQNGNFIFIPKKYSTELLKLKKHVYF